MNLDDDELDLAMHIFKYCRREATNSKGEFNGYSMAMPIGCYALAKLDALIARIEQHQKDQAEERADVER